MQTLICIAVCSPTWQQVPTRNTGKVAYLWQGDVVDLLGAQATEVDDLGCVGHVDLNIRDLGSLVHQVWQGRQVDVQGVLGAQLQRTKPTTVYHKGSVLGLYWRTGPP